MDFREKIDKILSIKGIKLWKLAEISDLHNTLEKAYEDNREMRATTTTKFLHNTGISSTWWETGEGPEFIDDSDKNITPVQKEAAVEQKSPKDDFLGTFRKMVEGDTEYVLIPRDVLRSTQLISTEQLMNDRKIMDKLLDQNEKLMARLLTSKAELPGVEKGKDSSGVAD